MTEPASSPDTESVETSAAPDTATQDVKPADPSPAEGDKAPETLLDKVRAALEPAAPTATNPDPESEESDDDPEEENGESEEPEDEIDDEELTRLNKKTRRRVKHLLGTIKSKNEEIDSLKPKAEQLDKVVGFISDAGLSAGEVDHLFAIGRNLKRDPRKAYEQLTPIFANLQRMFGDVLPDDLEQQVKTGKITREAAREVIRSRTEAALSTKEADRVRQQREEDEARRQGDEQVTRIQAAATEWETRQASKDPDWNAKQADVMDAIELEFNRLARNGEQLTVEKAIEIANKAKAKVDEKLKKFMPKPTEAKPLTDVSSTPSTPKPETMLDAARLALARGG